MMLDKKYMMMFQIKKHLWARMFVFAVLVSGWGLLLYSNTLMSTFHFDDWFFIIKNQGIRDLSNFFTAGRGVLGHSSRFLTFYSFAIDYHFHGLNPTGYRITNICIHLVNAFLAGGLAHLVVTVFERSGKNRKCFAERTALLTSALFLVHPLQTQAVTYISQRFTSLAAGFYLLSVALYIKGRIIRKPSGVRAMVFAGALAAALLGMASKELVITLPLMILFCEWFLFGNGFDSGHKKRRPWMVVLLILVSAMSLIVPAFFSFNLKGMFLTSFPSGSHQGDLLTAGTYLLTQARVVVALLRLFFYPVGQNVFYDFPMSRYWWDPATLLSLLMIGALIFWAIKQRRHRKMVSFGVLWFFISYLDNLVPRGHLIWEHKLYLPSFGLCLAAGSMLSEGVNRKPWARVLMIGLILVLSAATFQRNRVWKNEITLWQNAVSRSPDQAKVNYGLGWAYYRDGQYDAALEYLNRAIRLNPDYFDAYISRGVIFGYQAQFKRALEDFNLALKIRPGHYEAVLNRGKLYFLVGNYPAAAEDFSSAVTMQPDDALVYLLRARAYVKLKQPALAQADLEKARMIKGLE